VTEESHKKSLRWYNQLMTQDNYVLGACLFQVGPGIDWETFRYTGQDNEGNPLTLMDELRAMALEPALAAMPSVAVEVSPPSEEALVEILRAAGQALLIPLNRKSKLYQTAQEQGLGERLTDEYEAMCGDQNYQAQIFEGGLVYAPAGQWDQIQVVPSPRTRTIVTPPNIPWTHEITGFHGNRWNYWEQHLQDKKIPGLTWHIFMEEALRHNPQLEADGYIFKAHKTYKMPAVEAQLEAAATPPTAPAVDQPLQPPISVPAPSDFVQVVDGKFHLKGQPLRFIGVNIRGLVHYGHDPEYFAKAPSEHRGIQLQQASDMNARLVRVFLAHKDATPEQIEGRLRETLDLIKRDFPNIYLLPALTNLYEDVPFYVRGDEKFYEVQGGKKILNHAFYRGGYQENYLPFVKHIVNAFKHEPHIFAWEMGNELKAEGAPDFLVDFLKTMATHIKSWDPYHLVTTGMISTRHAWMGNRPDLRQALYSYPHLDFITIHAYNGNEHPPEIEDDSDLARQFGKPFIIEEAGFDVNKYGDRPHKTRTDMANWFRNGASCYMPWGFVATEYDNNDGDLNMGMVGPKHADWDGLYELHKQCGHLLLTKGFDPCVSQDIANINYHPTRGLPVQLPWPLVTDGFDFPVGKPDGQGYYVAATLVDQAYYAERKFWHTGEDWNRILGPGDTPDVDLGDPVYAVANGRVVTAHHFPTWGNIILMEHRLPWGQTVWSQYAHLRQRFVRKGDVVRRGQQIGTIGKGAGDQYPAHLHFEIRLKNLSASKWGWKTQQDRDKVLQAYAHPTNFINSNRPR
jgi:hypothetical protein